MYVSLPKNYGGVAFAHKAESAPPAKCTSDPAPPPVESHCAECVREDKNPISCLLRSLGGKGKGGFDSEDFLLIGLIALLLGKEGNEDILLILALLLMM